MKKITLIFIRLLLFMTLFKSHSEQHIENTDYQLILPTQDSTLSFIVHKNKVGVYDNIHHKELLLKDQVDGIKITPINIFKTYIDVLVENSQGKLTIVETYILSKDKDAKVFITKTDSKKRESSNIGYYYENNIRLINNDIVIHNLSAIEPSLEHSGLRLFQKSSVYSLKENRFVIPPKHIRIEASRSPEYEKKSLFFFKSFAIEEEEAIHQMEYYDEEGGLYELPIENFRYGMYSEYFQVLIDPSDSKIHSMRFGGFNKGNGTDELYDKFGSHLSTENINVSGYKEVFITREYVIVRHSVYEEEQDLSDEKVYSFYDKTGQFIESKSMEISKFLQFPQKALGIVTSYDKDFEYITYNGVFDFDKRAFVIPDIYDEIKIDNDNETDYYFSCRKKDSLTYYDKDFKIFNLPSK